MSDANNEGAIMDITIEINGREFIRSDALKEKMGICESTLWQMMNKRGMPKPIKLGRRRFFDREAVDMWLLEQS